MEENSLEKIEIGPNKEAKPARWKSAVSVAVVLVIVYFIVRWLIAILIPVVALILLIANRDLTVKVIRWIYKMYKDETYKGLLATLGAVIGFIPFIAFLFGRSMYNMFIVEKKVTKEEEKDSATSQLINIAIKEKVKDILGSDDDNKQR